MTTRGHKCFTCKDFMCSFAMKSFQSGISFLIGDCLYYLGKNTGERKTCKYYKPANDEIIASRERMIKETSDE